MEEKAPDKVILFCQKCGGRFPENKLSIEVQNRGQKKGLPLQVCIKCARRSFRCEIITK